MTDLRNRRVTRPLVVLIAIVVVAILASACSKKKDDKEAGTVNTDESEIAECKDVDLDDTENLPVECANALFQHRVVTSEMKALRALDDAKIRDIGSGICAFAASLSSDPTQVTDMDALIEANSDNWGLDDKATREVIDLAEVICPNDIRLLKQLTSEQEPVNVTLEATGSAKVQISFTGTDADEADQLVEPPWTKEVTVSKSAPLELIVFPSSPEGVTTGCRITVGDIELATAEGGDGQMSLCRANPLDIKNAAQGIAPQTNGSTPDETIEGGEPAPDPGDGTVADGIPDGADTVVPDAGEAGN